MGRKYDVFWRIFRSEKRKAIVERLADDNSDSQFTELVEKQLGFELIRL